MRLTHPDPLPPLSSPRPNPAGGSLVRRGSGILPKPEIIIAAEPSFLADGLAWHVYNWLVTLAGNYGGFLDGLAQYGVTGFSYGGYVETDSTRQYRAVAPDPAQLVLWLTDSPPSAPGFAYGVDYCAFHDTDPDGPWNYACLPRPTAQNCGIARFGVRDALLMVAQHELVEALTDSPPGQGWGDSSGEESDDFAPCLWTPTPIVASDGTTYQGQTYWRNDTNACWWPNVQNTYSQAALQRCRELVAVADKYAPLNNNIPRELQLAVNLQEGGPLGSNCPVGDASIGGSYGWFQLFTGAHPCAQCLGCNPWYDFGYPEVVQRWATTFAQMGGRQTWDALDEAGRGSFLETFAPAAQGSIAWSPGLGLQRYREAVSIIQAAGL